jgi:hypothetical protein
VRRVLKLTLLVALLGVVRIGIGHPLERLFLGDRINEAMAATPGYFNMQFSTLDWVTFCFYSFAKWFAVSAIYIKLDGVVHGRPLVRSLKVYGVMFVFFASVSAIYMNQYNHPSDFYVYQILQGLLIFTLMAVANALIYPHVFRDYSARRAHGPHRVPILPHSPAPPGDSPNPTHELHHLSHSAR